MPRIAGGLGGTRHCHRSRQGIVQDKNGRAPAKKIAVEVNSDTCELHGEGMNLPRPYLPRVEGHRKAEDHKKKVMPQSIRERARIRQNREDNRSTEDDIARARLGPRGQKGMPDTATMTEDSKLQTPSPLDPGHTA